MQSPPPRISTLKSTINWIGVLICFTITPSKESLSILSPLYAHLATTLLRSHSAFQNSISLSLLAKEIRHSLRKWSTWNFPRGIERGDYILKYESHIHVNWKPNADLTMNNNNIVILKGMELMVQCLKVHHVFGMHVSWKFLSSNNYSMYRQTMPPTSWFPKISQAQFYALKNKWSTSWPHYNETNNRIQNIFELLF